MSKKPNLKQRVKALEAETAGENRILKNSLTSLVSATGNQSNLTSFNPILQNNLYAPLTLNWMALTYMYKTHGVIQTAIDMPVLDAFRGGLDFNSGELDQDDIKILRRKLADSRALDAIKKAMIWARLYGGAAIIINTEQDATTPLNLKRMETIEFYAANRWELTSSNGWKPNFTPLFGGSDPSAPITSEFFYFHGHQIHSSRVITLAGKEAPYLIKAQLSGWGMSEVERMVEDFNGYIRTKEVIYELLEEAKVDVFRLKDLNVQLATAAGTAKTQDRVALMNQLKSFQRAIVMDMNDEFEQKQLAFTGLAEITKENRINISSALRMPMTKLFGMSSTGFNSGEDDIENYNAMVESEIREPLKEPIEQILDLLTLSLWGADLDLEFDFKSLRVMSSIDEETVKTSKQNRYTALYDRALLTSAELGALLEKEKMMPIATDMSKGILEDHPENPAMQGNEEPGEESTGKKNKEKN